MSSEAAQEVRAALVDPERLCRELGLLKGAERAAGGIQILCPNHGERTPSCLVSVRPDRTVGVKCFACDFAVDALGLIAHMHNLDTRSDFKRVLEIGAEMAGLHQLADEIRDGKPRGERPKPRPMPAPPTREYPPSDELDALLGACREAEHDVECMAMLESRGFLRGRVSWHAPALPKDGPAIPWARYRGKAEAAQPWTATGHRLMVRMYDATGTVRSVRAWRVVEGESPKRLPPAGCKSSELVMCNGPARDMLRRDLRPKELIIVEGEPDWLTWTTRTDLPVLGLVSGSWTKAFAEAVPVGCKVALRTHNDEAGDKYARQVADSLANRCPIWRSAGRGDENDRLLAGKLPENPFRGCDPMNQAARDHEDQNPIVLTVREVLKECAEEAIASKPRVTVNTGVWALDDATGGIGEGDVWLLGAETNWGKSCFAVMLADITIRRGYGALIVSTEDGPKRYGNKLLLRRSRVNAKRFRLGKLTSEDMGKIDAVVRAAEAKPVYLDARGKSSEVTARQVDRVLTQHPNIRLVVYDYAQEFRSSARHQDRKNELAAIGKMLRAPVQLHGRCGIIMSQITKQEGKTWPDKDSIRDCRDLSNAADAIMMGFTPLKNIERNGDVIVAAGQKSIFIDKVKEGDKGFFVPMDWDDESKCFNETKPPEDPWHNDFDNMHDVKQRAAADTDDADDFDRSL